VPRGTTERMATYLRVIDTLASHGVATAPSTTLAQRAGVSAAQFRKDLSLAGATSGVRGSGYVLSRLRGELRRALGGFSRVRFVIVGAGNLGRALASSSAFRRDGLDLVAIFDVDPRVVGSEVAGLRVRHDSDLGQVIAEQDVAIAVIAVSEDHAQVVADNVVGAGVREILNFVPVALRVPTSVEIRTVDLGVELQMLAIHARRT